MSMRTAVRTPVVMAGIAISAIGLTIMGGCDESATEPTPTVIASTPSFGIVDAPETSGIVMRGETLLGLTWVDVNTGLRLVLGFDPAAWCMGAPTFDVEPFQDVDQGDGRIIDLVQGGDMTTSVWDFLPIDCGRYLTEDPAAYGLANIIGTDNDIDGDRPERKNANIWGWRAFGTLSTPSGGKAQLSAHQTLLYPEPGGPVYLLNGVVRLQ